VGKQSCGQPIEGIISGGKTHYDVPSKNKIANEYLKTLFANKARPERWNFGKLVKPVNVFTTDDLLDAIKDHNSGKAIGPDLLDSSAWDDKKKTKFATEMAEILNSGIIPDYLKEAGSFLLSKKDGVVCPLEETRCIQLLPHALKIMEKAIYAKMVQSKIFETGQYQTGFKAGSSCGVAQSEIIQAICKDTAKNK
jgi:hypothetical protein